jgi:tetratricopeptide (TPR) repeat protein
MVTISKQKSAPAKRAAAAASGKRGAVEPTEASGAVAPSPVAGAAGQSELYEQAAALFHQRDYAAALSLFEQATQGPLTEMAHSARLHASMCRRRTGRSEVQLRTAEEHYNYAVALINERNLSQAEQHLVLALAQAPQADYLYYALALARGLAGDVQGAYSYLGRAIELEPRNRIAARNDSDFSGFARVSPIAELLYPERSGAR